SASRRGRGGAGGDGDPPLQQRLLVLRCVILEVLGQVAVATRDTDRLDDLLAFRSLELGKLGREASVLIAGHLFAHARRPPVPGPCGWPPSGGAAPRARSCAGGRSGA